MNSVKEDPQRPEPEKIDYETYLKENGFLIYWVRGISMRPLIRQDRDHYKVLPKPGGRLKKYDVALYRRPNGDYVLHRILRIRPEDYGIRGDNTYRMEYGIHDTDILGVMSEFCRDGGKWTSVEDPLYKAYARFWHFIYPLRWCYVRAKHLGGRVLRRLNLRK